MPDPLPFFVQPFLDSLKFEKRYSTTRSVPIMTIWNSFRLLRNEFGEPDLKDNKCVFRAQLACLLKEAKLTGKTINRKISSLKVFFKYQMRMGVLEPVLWLILCRPKLQKLPAYIEQKDMDVLLNDVEFPDNLQGKTENSSSVFFTAPACASMRW